MKKLLIIQSFNANKGNASVMHAMKQTLLGQYPDVRLSLTAYDPSQAKEEYGIECAEWAMDLRAIKLAPTNLKKIYYMLREGLWILYSFIWLLFYRLGIHLYVPGFKKNTVNLYLENSVIVLPGGHMLTSLNSLITNIAHFYGLFFALALNKRTMVYAETIGPFYGRWKILTQFLSRYLLKRVDLVTIRDRNSLEYCRNVRDLSVTAECVFGLETDPSLADSLQEMTDIANRGRLLVGVTIHHLYFRQYFSREQYVNLMSSIFDRIVEEFDAEILIVPMEDACHKGGDRPIAQEMISQARQSEHMHILGGEHSCLITCSVLSKMDVFVGTKTHSIVYGLKSGVPTVSISYHEKSNEFMQMFGMRDHAINLKDLNVEDFMVIFRKVVADRKEIKEKQDRALIEVRKIVCENNRLLVGLFK